MDRDVQTHEQVPTSPCASYEKPRVPLNNLKMKFEKGEDTKVIIDLIFETQMNTSASTENPSIH